MTLAGALTIIAVLRRCSAHRLTRIIRNTALACSSISMLTSAHLTVWRRMLNTPAMQGRRSIPGSTSG
ncbi:TilS substrate-binding domain-containing protein [Raoultella planticola]|uniref:TilS substrate-binding domain-containing protein n=1 Tax=Raoultella planticola TaxID=575 RepID=UPI0036289D7A